MTNAGQASRGIMSAMKTTLYFEEQVLVKRPYLKREWCERALKQFVYRDVQEYENRVRYWIFIEELGKYLRVVTLEDGETVHNAFPDRNFKGKRL
jgi:uncharacterized membrane protein